MKSAPLRIGVAALFLALVFGGIGYVFWQQELKYQLPTPVPQDYTPPAMGSTVNLAGKLRVPTGKPVFIHFFNPDCPCSRFNMPQFKSLVRQYGRRMAFAVVLLAGDKEHDAATIAERYDLGALPISSDENIADACGVYSTPQAVLLDADHRLYYRGNYNKSRYCTDVQTAYARMAIDSFLAQQSRPAFSQFALTAYGCSLPNCSQ